MDRNIAHSQNELNDETIDCLQELSKRLNDSADGFTLAAKENNSPILSNLFSSIAVQRRQFVSEINSLIRRNDEETPKEGTLLAKAHRWWMSARANLAEDNSYQLLAEIERGEDSMKETYEEVIQKTSATPVSDLLHRQFIKVKATHDQMRALRDQYKQ